MKNKLLLIAVLLIGLAANAQFTEGDSVLTFFGAPIDHQLFDIENDGDYDLLQVSTTNIIWYENLGDENFDYGMTILGGIEGKKGLELSDMNGDGLLDFVAIYTEGEPVRKISSFMNNGDGTFAKTELVVDFVDDFILFDDDADGDDELFYITTTAIRRLEGNGDGTFGADLIIADDGYNFTQLFHTDFDNDGDRDIVAGKNETSYAIVFIENTGGGSYAPESLILDDLESVVFWGQFVDADGDGDEDWLIGTGYDYNAINYYENTGGALGAAYLVHFGVKGYSRMADVNLDGLADIVSPDGSSKHQWFENLGDGTFSDGIPIPEVPITWDSGVLVGSPNIQVIDIDGDGDMEVCGDASQDSYFYVVYDNILGDAYNASGSFFADLNENGVWDVDEVSVAFPIAVSDPEEITSYTSAEGNYTIAFESGVVETYTVSPELPAGWAVSDPIDYEIVVDGIAVWEGLDFGIYPVDEIDSIATSLVGAYPRCGEVINYWAGVHNYGTTLPSGIINVELDELVTYVSSEIEPDSIVGQHVYWHYDEVTWYESYNIPFQVLMPDFDFAGDEIISNISTTIENDLEETIFTATDDLSQIIVCAYDPNDKTVSPVGIDEAGYIDINSEWLEYVVRFQNTGTDTAVNITIEDQLDENFDWSTFETISSSHDMASAIDLAGVITFDFEDIMLPDSNVNYIGSQGFVQYKVKLIEGLTVGTEIENTADIYFDFNPPITTNTTLNTLFDCETILANVFLPDVVCFGDTIIGTTEGDPIPSTTEFNWNLFGDEVIGDGFYALTETAGEYLITVTASTDFCSSEEIFSVEVLEEIPLTILLPETICDGDSVMIFGLYRTMESNYYEMLLGASGCDSIVSKELIVNDLPSVNIEELDDETVCLDQGPIILIATPDGGAFTGEGLEGGTFHPNVAGEGEFVIYYTFVDDNSCVGIDSIIINVVDCLGIKGVDYNSIQVYPNPFSEFTNIAFGNSVDGNQSVVIRDVLGKEVFRLDNVNQSNLIIQKANFTEGIYIISLIDSRTGEEVWNEKLIVE